MAIGDTPNQNLFGTNYNAEEEERKKAELAAQGAMMGAGEGTQGSNRQGGFFKPGGFGYEYLGPRLGENIGKFAGEQLYGTGITAEGQATGFPVDRPSLAGDLLTLPGTALNVVGDFVTDPIVAGGKLAKDVADYATGSTGVQAQQDAQAASVASDLGTTPSVTPPVERPTAGAQEQPEAVVSPFLQSPDTPSGLGGPLLRGFEMVNDAARGPNAPMGQDATRAALGGMTLNEYLNAPAGTPGVSGLRTDPQGRMITPSAQPPVDSAVPAATTQPSTGPVKVPDEIMSQVARPSGQTAEFRDGNRDGIEDREQGIFRPGELIGYDAQGNEVRSPGTQQPVNRIPASSQPPVDALSSFEKDSLARQQRIGGTGSFEGDSEAREARLRENERRPGESQADRDTRVAQSKTTGGQTAGLSFDDARRRAEGQLAARGVRNPSASQVNALARSIQAAEPERLAELETKRALDAIKLRDAEAKKDFKPQIVEIGDQRLIQLAPEYYQPIRPEPKEGEPFEPRILEHNGFIYFERKLNEFERQPSTKAGGAAGEVSSAIADAIAAGGGEVATATPAPTVDTPEVATGDEFTPQQELGIQKVMADNEITRGKAIEELRKAGKLK
jgi:hypothetical protein